MTKLEEIVAYKRQELAELKRAKPVAQLERALKGRLPLRDFRKAVHRAGTLSLIAEVKRASPSAGPIRPNADALEIATQYEKAGAQAISVLTESKFFQGSLTDLTKVKQELTIPLLRKDFLLEEYQVLEAAAAGADAVLLIVAILSPDTLRRLISLTWDLGMEALVEVHTERECGQAQEAGATVVGINNRDLATFQVDLGTTERLIQRVLAESTVVAESGLRTREDVERMRHLGVHAVLIGEELISSGNIEEKVKELMGCG